MPYIELVLIETLDLVHIMISKERNQELIAISYSSSNLKILALYTILEQNEEPNKVIPFNANKLKSLKPYRKSFHFSLLTVTEESYWFWHV